MIVVDASVGVDLLLGTEIGRQVMARTRGPRVTLHAPALLDVEVTQALRRLAAAGTVSGARAALALEDLDAWDVQRHDHRPLLKRIWALRDNLAAYDAAYVALAEALDARLLTRDRRLARAPGIRIRCDVV
jgi:predicted nucleic acid-binding protein